MDAPTPFEPVLRSDRGLRAARMLWLAHEPVGDLHPDELEAVDGAVLKRRIEFTAGRACARAALADLGIAPVPIPRGPRREPVWPDGIAGSISHTSLLAAAVAAPATELAAVGLDLELEGSVDTQLGPIVATGEELETVAGDRDALTVLLSVKEAVYKCLFALDGTEIAHHDAVVTLGHRTAAVRLAERSLTVSVERWNGHVVSLSVLDR